MKNVLYAVTRNLYQDAYVSMKSLVHHTKVDNVFMFVEDDYFPFELPDLVKTINVSDQKWFVDKGENYKNRCTYMVMMRVVASEYLDVDQVLSIDYDTLTKKDIAPLFDYNIDDYYFAAAREPNKNFPVTPAYYNFGVALLNLKKIRGIVDEAVSFLNYCYFDAAEQDLMNILCQKRILEIPSIYNANAFTEKCPEEDIVIKHFPWKDKWRFHTDLDYKKFLTMPWKEVLSNAE